MTYVIEITAKNAGATWGITKTKQLVKQPQPQNGETVSNFSASKWQNVKQLEPQKKSVLLSVIKKDGMIVYMTLVVFSG